MFDGVRDQLRRSEIQRGLQRFGQTPGQRARERGRNRGAGAQRAHCLIQPAIRQQRRANTPHQSAQLLQGRHRTVLRLGEHLLGAFGVFLHERGNLVEGHAHGDQVRLNPIVKVAFDA